MTSGIARTRITTWGGPVGAALVLGVLGWRVGAGPFVAGLEHLTAATVLAAAALTAGTTVAAAWRWTVIGRAFGAALPFRRAVSAYYRSQFLNSVLPGGVAGDVDRGLDAGASTGSRIRGLRIVGWDRATGQVVQGVLLAVVLLAVDSPLRPPAAWAVGFALLAVVAVLLGVGRAARRSSGRPQRIAAALDGDLRRRILRPSVLIPVLVSSILITGAHTAVFLLAAVSTGTVGSAFRLLPLALVVQVGMAVPIGIAGWGPREGVAAATFAAAGLGAGHGVSAATAYGVLALLAVLPGAVVLVLARRGRHRAASRALDVPSTASGRSPDRA